MESILFDLNPSMKQFTDNALRMNNMLHKAQHHESKAKTLYVCNLVTQPGETDDYKVSDHVKVFQKYLGKDGLDAVIANNTKMSAYLVKKYASEEQKDPVPLDKKTIEKLGVHVIEDKIYKIEDNMLRHDSLKTAYLIFSYLMDEV